MYKEIQAIHASELYGTIIECGNGCSIVNALMNVEGASNTIYESRQPYSKTIQKERYKGVYDRSVSLKFVQDVIKTEVKNNTDLYTVQNHFLLVTSFQLRPPGRDIKTLTHGWIGVSYKGKETYYHFSIPETKNRGGYFSIIANFGVNLLSKLLKTNESLFTAKYLDQVVPGNNKDILATTLKHTIFNTSNTEDFFISINSKNEVVRFEDIIRDKEGLILQKGSYNPIHDGHTEIMNLSMQTYPTYASAFLISIYRYDKPAIGVNDLVDRIKSITDLGYNVIICKFPLFKNSLQWLRGNTKYRQLSIVFPMGIDTINRIVEAEVEEKLLTTPNSLKSSVDWAVHFNSLVQSVYAKTIFLLFVRQGYTTNDLVQHLWKITVYNITYTDPNAVSSTKIRNQA